MIMQKLNAEESFKAMYFFLDNYYQQKYFDYLGGVLGELSISQDGRTMDPAAGLDWLECLEEAVKEPLTEARKKKITIDEAYDAMYRLIARFIDQTIEPERIEFLKYLGKYKEKGVDSEIGKKWLVAVDKAKTNDYPLDVNNFKRYSSL